MDPKITKTQKSLAENLAGQDPYNLSKAASMYVNKVLQDNKKPTKPQEMAARKCLNALKSKSSGKKRKRSSKKKRPVKKSAKKSSGKKKSAKKKSAKKKSTKKKSTKKRSVKKASGKMKSAKKPSVKKGGSKKKPAKKAASVISKAPTNRKSSSKK